MDVVMQEVLQTLADASIGIDKKAFLKLLREKAKTKGHRIKKVSLYGWTCSECLCQGFFSVPSYEFHLYRVAKTCQNKAEAYRQAVLQGFCGTMFYARCADEQAKRVLSVLASL